MTICARSTSAFGATRPRVIITPKASTKANAVPKGLFTLAPAVCASLVLLAAPANADNLLEKIEKAAAGAVESVEQNVEKAAQVTEGKSEFDKAAPNLDDRFQSGGTGGAGPSAGKPQGIKILKSNY